jgi:hypothetical protein
MPFINLAWLYAIFWGNYMFIVYRNTTDSGKAIAQFYHLEQATAFMEYHALRENDPTATGYQVIDGTNTLRGEYEL